MARKVILITACLLLVAGVAAAAVVVPTQLFRAQDAALLGTHEYPTGTGTLEVPAEELAPVLATVYATEYVEGGEYVEQDLISSQSTEEMDTLLPRVWEYSEALAQAGALPQEMYDYIMEVIFTRDTLNFSHYIESTGVEVINTNTGMGTTPPYYFSYYIDMSTDLVMGYSFQLPPDAPYLPGRLEDMRTGWLQYLGLDTVSDWAPYSAIADNADGNGNLYHSAQAGSLSDSLRLECGLFWMADPVEYKQGSNTLSASIIPYRYWADEWWEEYRAEHRTYDAAGGAADAPDASSVVAEMESG